jgi:Zn finger protein HypA/HybF involved in hydrogenase expression
MVSQFRNWVIFITLFLAVGCKKDPAVSSLESDARGFFCKACQAKFYTDWSVYAERCPQCKSEDIRPVVGFLCYQDQHLNLTPQGPKAMTCEKCQGQATGLKMPHEAELKSWGAVKRSKSEVGPK